MRGNAHAAPRLPAKDLDRARAFYRDKLGLEPTEERAGGLRHVLSDTEFAIFVSDGASTGTFTQMVIYDDDIEATVSSLRERRVEFESVDVPELQTHDGTAEVEGNTRARGREERAA